MNIHAAIESESYEDVQKAIEAGADINSPGKPDSSIMTEAPLTPLQRAIGKNYKITELIIKSGADINSKGDYGVNILLLLLNEMESDHSFLSENSIPDQEERDHVKYSNGIETLKILLSKGVEVNAKDDEGLSIRYYLDQMFLDEEIVNLLHKHGCKDE